MRSGEGTSALKKGPPLLLVGGVLGAAMLASVPSFAADDAGAGAKLFRQRCAACHAVAPGAPSGIGPNLAGVVGRPAASVPGYRYSRALSEAKPLWSAEALDRYLEAPIRMVPGTRKTTSVPDAGQRAALIAYLAGLKE